MKVTPVFLKQLVQGGPAILAHALRQAWISHRIRWISTLMDRERALHQEHMVQLRAELNALQVRQNSTTARVASFCKGLSS